MSFSTKVKKELCDVYGDGKCCYLAELAGIFNVCGAIVNSNNKTFIKMQTEKLLFAKKIYELIIKALNFEAQIIVRSNLQFKKTKIYIIEICEDEYSQKFLYNIRLLDKNTGIIRKNINKAIVSKVCCRRAYIRGAFISSGSITDPEKTYHMEFLNYDNNINRRLMLLINSFNLRSKIIKRKTVYVVYIKEGEGIVDLLNIMGAHLSLMEFENIRIVKDVRNSINRIVNCETANLGKTINASIKQIEDINYIKNTKGLSYLSEKLESIAIKRLEYPDESLKSIGEMLVPPIGKSGVNHRLRKISEIADALRGGIL